MRQTSILVGAVAVSGPCCQPKIESSFLSNMAIKLTASLTIFTLTGLMQALGAAEKVFQLIDRKPKIDVSAGTEVPASFEGHIKFDNVSFAYPTRENQSVLQVSAVMIMHARRHSCS